LAASTNCNDIANDCDRVYAISASQNNIFIGGTFTNSNATFAPALTATTSSMAWWNRKANTWSAMDGGVTAPVSGVIPGWMQGVRALVMDRSSLYAGGEFMTAKGSTVPAARISRWSQTIADLALYGTVSPTGTVYVGDQIAYNLTIENLGYATATGTSLYATLPAGVTLLMRSNMLDVMQEDFVTLARMKGISEWKIMLRHAARNALLPVVTAMAMGIGFTMGGDVVVETIFSWPGLGRMLVRAVSARDYPVAQGAFLTLAAVMVFLNLLADLLYYWLDPRVGRSKEMSV